MNGINTSQTADGENRIKTNGQVFTPDSIVNEMLDSTDRKLAEYICGLTNVDISQVSDDDYISYIVLEPTCGDGNFIVRELERKLLRVQNYAGIEQNIALLKAISSIHGIELTAENVIATKLRMMEVIEKGSTKVFELDYKNTQPFKTTGFNLSDDMRKCIHYILDRNIQCGDVLKSTKYLIKKSSYINDIWGLDVKIFNRANSLFSTDTENYSDLVLTQYDFEDGKAAIRERSYKNMHSNNEMYINESLYIPYNKMYTLPETNVYTPEDTEEITDF